MNLTSNQKDALHKGMLGYLVQMGFDSAAESFAKESKLKHTPDMKDKLERKWRSIIRLETKIMELNEQNVTLADDIGCFGREGAVDDSESIPDDEKHLMEMHSAPVTCVHFHPKFNIVVTGSEDNTIIVWNAESGQFEGKILKGHTDFVQCLAFNPSGTILASGSNDTGVRLWDFGAEMDGTFKTTKELLGHEHTVSSCCWDKSGEFLYTASRDKFIKKWELSTGHCKKSFKGHTDWVRYVTLSPDEKMMASCGNDCINVWDIATGNVLTSLRDHDHVILVCQFANAKADKQIIETILDDDDKKVAKVAVKTRAEALEGKEDPGGMHLISCSRDKTIRMWSIGEGVCVRTFTGHDGWVRDVQFHPSGRYFISCSDDGSVRVWDMKKFGRQCVKFENAHESFVQCLDWNKHSPMLVTGGVKNGVKLWSASPAR